MSDLHLCQGDDGLSRERLGLLEKKDRNDGLDEGDLRKLFKGIYSLGDKFFGNVATIGLRKQTKIDTDRANHCRVAPSASNFTMVVTQSNGALLIHMLRAVAFSWIVDFAGVGGLVREERRGTLLR